MLMASGKIRSETIDEKKFRTSLRSYIMLKRLGMATLMTIIREGNRERGLARHKHNKRGSRTISFFSARKDK